MSTIKAENIAKGANSTNMDNAIFGSAKAWVNFDGTGTVAIRSAYNVSSITDNGTGSYAANFTTAFANANYSSSMSGGYRDGTLGIQSTSINAAVGSVGIVTSSRGGTSTDAPDANVAVFAS